MGIVRQGTLRFLRMLSGGFRGAANGLFDPPSPTGGWITIRRKDGALVTAWLDPDDLASIERFLDAVRVPAPRTAPPPPRARGAGS